MTLFIVLLTLLVVIAITLGLCLVDLSHHDPHVFGNSDELLVEFLNLDTYAPMTRLFARADFDFLRNYPPQLIRKLRRSRRHAMGHFLGEVRRDFYRAWSVCRLLAPMSDDHNLHAMILRQVTAFHVLYFRILLRCLVGRNGHVAIDVEELVEALRGLQTSATQVLEAGQAHPGGEASA